MKSSYLHLIPDAGDLGQSPFDGLGLFRVFGGQAVRLFAQVAELVFDGDQVSLHSRQLPLQSHDSSQVVPQLLGRLDHLEEHRNGGAGELG